MYTIIIGDDYMVKELNETIGARVKDTRYRRSLSREKLAEKAEISTQFLADIESGKKGMSAATLCKLCVALNVSADYLIFGSKSQNSLIPDMIKNLDETQLENAEKLLEVFLDAIKK